MTDGELDALHQVFWRLESRWSPPTPDADVHHAYQALPPLEFMPPMRDAEQATEGRRFIDVGCGVGRNMAIAHCLGWQVTGIDLHLPYLKAAAELVPEATLIHSDAFDVDTFDADLVYVYRPMVDASAEARLETHVVERMKPGSLLFTTSPQPPVPMERAGRMLWRVG